MVLVMDGNMALLLLLLLPALLAVYLRRRHGAPAAAPSANHCPHPNRVLGNTVPLLLNLHRFLDWATDLLAASPASTIEVRGLLGLGTGVATASPEAVDHLLRANFPYYVKGARFAVPFADLLGRGMFLADGRLWSLQRKLASYSFSSRSLRRFSGRVLRDHLRGRLIPLLDAAAGSGEAVDLQDVLRRFTFDNICRVAFGVESSTLLDLELEAGGGQRRRHEAFFDAFDDAVEISFGRILQPTTLVWRAMRLANVGSERRMRAAVRVIDEYVMGMVEASEQSRAEEHEQHLLSRFAAAMDEEAALGGELGAMFDSPDAKRRFLRDVVVSFVMAGKDSTSTALTWFFWLLAANPRCELRVHEEVTRLHRPVDDAENDDESGYEELKGMHYLHAAITEAMRLYPPVPINTRVAVSADVLPDGTAVRAGWFADYSAYAMGRMPRLWGDRCREFLPERWLDDNNGEFVAADAARYPVFHAGPRACLGKEMAYVQMKAVAAAVVRRFQVETVPAPASMDAPPPYGMGVTLRMKGGLRVRIRRQEDARHRIDQESGSSWIQNYW